MNVIGLVVFILFGLILSSCSALHDNGKRFYDHTFRFLFRAIVVVIASGFNINAMFVMASTFYLLFDYMLNVLEGRDIHYIGKTAKLDRLFLFEYGALVQFILKVSLWILSILTYLNFFNFWFLGSYAEQLQ
jgi:small-conductance mechanosensitive channel